MFVIRNVAKRNLSVFCCTKVLTYLSPTDAKYSVLSRPSIGTICRLFVPEGSISGKIQQIDAFSHPSTHFKILWVAIS
jgi:hypothetical protein